MEIRKILKWGLIFFVVTLLWSLFEKWMGWHGERISQHAQYANLYDILFAGIYVLAFRDGKRKAVPGSFTFRQGILYGATLTGIITLLSPLIQTVIHSWISPEFFPNVIQLATDNHILSPEEAQAKFNLGNYIVENLIGTFLLGLICTLLLALLFRTRSAKVAIDQGK
ncbi:MAG: DUF4199 domain-containing protein [Saprospiraceae bacterium]|nr:DUF4199 domain-containing protein [Lewinella sp.]